MTDPEPPPRSKVLDVLRELWEEKKSPEIGFTLAESMMALRNAYVQVGYHRPPYQNQLHQSIILEGESLIKEALEINSEAHRKYEHNHWMRKEKHRPGKTPERWYRHWDFCFTRQRVELLYLASDHYEQENEAIEALVSTIELAEGFPKIRLAIFFRLLYAFESSEEEFSAKKICSLYWEKIQSDFPEDIGAPINNDPVSRGPYFFVHSALNLIRYDNNQEFGARGLTHPLSSEWMEDILREDWSYDSETNLVEFIEAQIGYSDKGDYPWRKKWILDAISKVSDMTPSKEKKRHYATMWEKFRSS